MSAAEPICGQHWRAQPPQSDRAWRLRANSPGCKPEGPRRCFACGAANARDIHHINGHEEDADPANLVWCCRSCNVRIANVMRQNGMGRKISQTNPAAAKGAQTVEQWALATSRLHDEHDEMSLEDAIALVRATPRTRRSEFAKEIWRIRRARYGAKGSLKSRGRKKESNMPDWVTNPGRRRNGIDEAAQLSSDFHGRQAKTVTSYSQRLKHRETLTDLAALEELVIAPESEDIIELAFEPGVRLASSPDGKQLYIVGGNQQIDAKTLRRFGADPDQDSIDLGSVVAVCYVTDKAHLVGSDGSEEAYHHFFGEEDAKREAGDDAVAEFYGDYDAAEPPDSAGFFAEFPDLERPRLIYDRLSQSLSFAGGRYRVRDVGITN